ncbi:MAG: iron-sulfur cluster assembly accessory protein [Candidatus Omnitrophica bacterium]|nr:iron-sulfur cluster assembly accessory protein [Candidatus Omnitrophota bacterium]
MIIVTEKAVQELKQLLEKEHKPSLAVRMAVKGGGCSGLTYHLAFEENPPKETDKVFETNGIKVVVDMKSYLYLNGTLLDYTTSLMGSGFQFNNPNAKKSCGCGVSFSA